jgi:hypothetical protein
MTIAEAYRRFSRLDLRSQVPIIFELTKEEMILLNQAQLYTESIDKDGDPLGGYKQIEYENLKIEMNPQLGGRVDLYLTGEFYAGFYVEVLKDEYIIGSKDSKSEELENKYGTAIFGLTDESKARYTREIFFRALRNYIETTGFKMV